ncbi:heme ABC transporter ATP-binding protein CcmA [Idiomarina tyrosinivorans]|uniref:Heme ABC transporter ATP-binding protein CcmA n=1 Tax=Idiomarina tyrosinivorans TaxID=1445662 RepID=A0A432ZPU4_9GAMM|nr:heme ABC transporter ATP-binding protein CcmA [Idiomarina tyrosinivorans]
MPPLLHAEQLTSIRAERCLFAGLSFAVSGGELLQVVGQNGSGKSTLLGILAGLASPDEGQVYYQQQALTTHREAFYQDLLFLGHKAAVKASLSALENVALQRQLDCGDSQPAPTEQDWDNLAQLDLLGLEELPAAQLSAGQQRRIALCRLWSSPAKVWILDEPFTALDQAGIELLHQRIDQHLAAGGCVVLTSHQPLLWQPQNYRTLTLQAQGVA